ncbi:MAG: copper amine oxidase N-terminal domain-containing protein, partial [Bacillota bacterium]
MKKQLYAALLASSLLTTSVVLASPPMREPLAEPAVPISAPAVTRETAALTIGEDTLKLHGKEIKLPFAPYLNQGVTMVPLEALAQFLNTRPAYNPQEDSVTITHQGKNMVSFRLGEAEVRVGKGTLKKLPAMTQLIENRTAIPLRALAELFDIEVQYENGVITLIRKAHQDYLIGFQALGGQLLPAFDYSMTPKVYVGYAKDYLTDYPKGEESAMILAVSQPGQELMIQSIEVKEDRVVVHVIPESRWSNAPEGTMSLVHYGPRRVVKLLDKLPDGLPIEIDGYEIPSQQQDYRVGFFAFDGKLQPSLDYSLEPKAYVGPAKDYLIDYPKGEDQTTILAVSQPGQELMIQGIEVKDQRVVVHVIPESRWSNAPEG